MNTKPSIGIRIASMVLDHIFMTIIVMLVVMPFTISNLASAMVISHDQESLNIFSQSTLYFFAFGFALYFCKDCIGGRSLAKRILKLQVVNSKTGVVANPLRCMVRNLFDILWPVEVIVTIISPSRRIGDYVAGTAVVVYQPTKTKPTINIIQVFIALLISFVFIASLFILFYSWIGKMMPDIKYVETSYNEEFSNSLEQIYVDNNGSCIDSVDIRIYDKVENSDSKYISIIQWLNADCPTEGKLMDEYHRQTEETLHQQIPNDSITGQVKYVLKLQNRLTIQTMRLD